MTRSKTPGAASAHGVAPADPWVLRWLADLPVGSRVLDFASGAGRHARAAADAGHRVTAIDRDAEALAGLARTGIECICTDLEAGPWPFAGRAFDAVVVTNYLFRARFALLAGTLAPGGRLVAATFAAGNAEFGRPRNPDFLLAPGELLRRAAAAGLMVLAYEHGLRADPAPAVVQRVCAIRPKAGQSWPGQLKG